MANDESNPQWYKTLLGVVIALLITAAGNGIIAWSDLRNLRDSVARIESDVDIVDSTLAAIAAQAHANTIHRVEHDKNAERWINQILENERDIREFQRAPKAGPDPFTGTEGAKLRDRIERLEQGAEEQQP